jgi:uncharacterized protein
VPGRRLALLLFVMTSACSHSTNKDSTTPLALATVVLHAAGRTLRVQVEVVRTPETRAHGLMERRSLPAQQGMLFIFERQEVQAFWMKNTYIPLDMIFIDENMTVVGIVENAEPLTTVSRRVGSPSRFVLEVNGGYARQHGVVAGARVVFEGLRL